MVCCISRFPQDQQYEQSEAPISPTDLPTVGPGYIYGTMHRLRLIVDVVYHLPDSRLTSCAITSKIFTFTRAVPTPPYISSEPTSTATSLLVAPKHRMSGTSLWRGHVRYVGDELIVGSPWSQNPPEMVKSIPTIAKRKRSMMQPL